MKGENGQGKSEQWSREEKNNGHRCTYHSLFIHILLIHQDPVTGRRFTVKEACGHGGSEPRTVVNVVKRIGRKDF